MTKLKELQDRTAAKIVERLTGPSSRRNSLLYLTGAAGSGKTTILRRMADHLRREGCWIPILVSAPNREHDAGPIALLETAGQLRENEILDGEVAILSDPRRCWADKMATITGWWIGRDDVVLLCDEPAVWYQGEESLLEHTPRLLSPVVRRVGCSWRPVPPDHHRLDSRQRQAGGSSRCAPSSPTAAICSLIEADWDILWEPASRLRDRLRNRSRSAPRWEMKLCVALASLLPRDEPRPCPYPTLRRK